MYVPEIQLKQYTIRQPIKYQLYLESLLSAEPNLIPIIQKIHVLCFFLWIYGILNLEFVSIHITELKKIFVEYVYNISDII